MHRLLLWIDIPDETHTGREILLQFALHLRCSIPCAHYFYRKIRDQRWDRLRGELSIGEALPGNKRDVRQAYQPGCQSQGGIRSQHHTQVVHVEKAAEKSNEP